jgi:hypothetical protein
VIYAIGAVVLLLLLAKYGRRFGLKTLAEDRAEKRAEERRQREDDARRAEVSRQIREAKLAAMSEEQREKYLAREFRVDALVWAVVFGIAAGGIVYTGDDLAKKVPVWLLHTGLVLSALAAIACAICAMFGMAGITVIFWLIGLAVAAYVIFGIDWTPISILIVVVALGFIGVINAINNQKRRD